MSKTSEPDMRVLKSATCKTLFGKSTLTHQIGCTPDGEIHLRIAGNDGGGFHSDEWVKFDDVQEALRYDDEGAAITSVRLIPLFKGKSVNTPSFLLAALKHLKLVRPMQGKQRHHERLDPGPFLEMVGKLTAAVKPKGTTGSTARKTVKKKAVTRRKKATTRSATTGKTTSV